MAVESAGLDSGSSRSPAWWVVPFAGGFPAIARIIQKHEAPASVGEVVKTNHTCLRCVLVECDNRRVH